MYNKICWIQFINLPWDIRVGTQNGNTNAYSNVATIFGPSKLAHTLYQHVLKTFLSYDSYNTSKSFTQRFV